MHLNKDFIIIFLIQATLMQGDISQVTSALSNELRQITFSFGNAFHTPY